MEYNTIIQHQADCNPDTCILFIGMEANEGDSEYLDVYMQGSADAWLAVGFSATATMVRI